METNVGRLRIGELGRRVGVTPELLRAWERRYGLLQPTRSTGGFRLYSEADEERVRAMQANLALGLSAAEAARTALHGPRAAEAPATDLPAARAALQGALEGYDETEVHRQFDGLLAAFGAGTVLADILLPVLRAIGEGWVEGRTTVAQEHFASSVIRGRLLGLARGWGRGTGPYAVLACPPGERHDLPLLIFGVVLREAGWRIVFLGADTPISTIESAAEAVDAEAVVLSAATPGPLLAVKTEVAAIAERRTVAIGGAGAEPAVVEGLGGRVLEGDPVAEATRFAGGVATSRASRALP